MKRNFDFLFFQSENIGESVVYLWVEKIREFLEEKADQRISKLLDKVSSTEFKD